MRMIKDLFAFLAILLILIIMFGVASQSLRHPNSEFNGDLMKKIFYEPYFNIFAELFLDEYDTELERNCNKTINGGRACSQSPTFAFILFVIFVMFGHILMISLLTAKLTSTIDRIMNESNIYYSYLRFFIVTEYIWRPLLCPPISWISIILSIRFGNVSDPFLKNYEDKEKIKKLEERGRNKLILDEEMNRI